MTHQEKQKEKRKKESMHRPGIEPGTRPWQGRILPLNHRCDAMAPLFTMSTYASIVMAEAKAIAKKSNFCNRHKESGGCNFNFYYS